MSEPQSPSAPPAWPDYRAVWRWHFYAGLFCIPFVILLSITGAIYLFKPQIEAWNDRAFDNLTLQGNPAAVSAQVQAALAAFPESTPSAYELPRVETGAGRVIVSTKDGERIRVYVHPESLTVLHSIPENDRFMRWIFKLHGELLMGDRGSNIVELAASWTIIMLATGLYLWWPRNAKGLGGVLYPRLRKGSGIFWRDIHSVVGIWISVFALFLLATGLPWAKFWGTYFKEIRQITGTAVAQQDWTVGAEESRKPGSTQSGEHAGHGGGSSRGGSSRWRRGPGVMPKDLTAFDRVVAAVRPLRLEHPVSVSPPGTVDSDEWTAKSDTQNRPRRVTLTVSGASGEVISREDFKDRHFVDRAVGYGIAAHEGQLFGWFNQLLGLLTAIGLILLSVSGVIMWWRRRDAGVLGAPRVLLNPRVSWTLITIIVLFGIYLPLFGASLLLVVLTEFAVLKRIPSVRNWLGLQAVAATVMLVTVAGCGGPTPVPGGTTGVLRSGSELLSEIQITVFRVDGATNTEIGFGLVQAGGEFQMMQPAAAGPLYLEPGDYCCTVESVGAPVVIPAEFAQPDTTPLKFSWSGSEEKLELELPPLKLSH